MPGGSTSYTVVGAGAVGLLYGTRLAVAGHRVHWLVRSGAEDIRRHGIEVRSEGDVLRIPAGEVDVHTDASSVPPADVVIVATKTTANDRLADLVRSVCSPGATVALFQNGLGAEERVRAEVPAAGPVLGAMCFVCAHRTGPGRADHLDYGAVTLAPLDEVVDGAGRPATEVAERLATDLRRAGVPTTVLGDLGVARWRKLVWNIPFNGLCTVLDASTDELLADPGTRRLVSDLMDEVITAAGAAGHPIERGFRDEMLATTDAMRSYAPSMKLDRDAGRPLEIDAIYQVAIDAARCVGTPMVRAEVLATQLRHLDPDVRARPDR